MRASGSSHHSVGASPIRIVALVVLAFFVGLAVRGFLTAGSSDDANAIGPAVGADATGSGPRSYVDGIPSGFAHTEDGARAAAIAYVLTGQRLLELVPTRVAAAVRSMAASGSADAQVTEADEQLRHLRETLADGTGPTRYLQAVIASRVDAFTPERARVSVWSVGVLFRRLPRLWAAALVLASGAAVEVIQGFVGRDADWGDLLADALGIATALLLWAIWRGYRPREALQTSNTR